MSSVRLYLPWKMLHPLFIFYSVLCNWKNNIALCVHWQLSLAFFNFFFSLLLVLFLVLTGELCKAEYTKFLFNTSIDFLLSFNRQQPVPNMKKKITSRQHSSSKINILILQLMTNVSKMRSSSTPTEQKRVLYSQSINDMVNS